MQRFENRREAGRALAGRVARLVPEPGVVVLGLPRGGVPVAHEVALRLDAPLDAFGVRKIGAPRHEEYAIGAIASGGVEIIDDERVAEVHARPGEVAAIVARERAELERREREYRGTRLPPDVAGRTVVLVDDGLATGSTMLAAVQALRQLHPARIVCAAPVASVEACALLRRAGVECVCLATPDPFLAVGVWYHDFAPTTDEEVRHLLASTTTDGVLPVS